MTKPTLDQRHVKRTGDRWTIEGKTQQANEKMLCQFCGLAELCPIFSQRLAMERTYEVKVAVRECGQYRPIIGFSLLKGLTGNFNTFRVGDAWARRVKVGGVLAIGNTLTDEIIGSARVTGVDSGPLQEMLDHHAHFNHMMEDVDMREAALALRQVLLRNYGPQMVHDGRSVSVIYMDRIDS